MLRLHDTRARGVVDVVPVVPGRLSVYACGPTVYRDAHVGNMRTFLLTDLIRRTATAAGLAVTVVQNITDVGHMADDTGLGDGAPPEPGAAGGSGGPGAGGLGGGGPGGGGLGGGGLGGVDEGQGDTEDRVLVQARLEGRGALEVARHYEDLFHRDLARMGILPADVYPRASESIGLMIELITTLMDHGHAYIGTDGSVFFDARSFPGYGALSGNRLEDLRPGHRFEGGVDPAKRFHADWALWKHAGPTRTQLVWDTPWGRGFPGWHTECSAMSLHHLGRAIDIHTGGIDLRFPHHEDERAQSDSAAGQEVVRHWVHAEHLLFEGRKMSKSAGNVVLVDDVIERGLDPRAVRLAFLEHHYRQQMNLTWNALTAADATLRRWRQRIGQWSVGDSAPSDGAPSSDTSAREGRRGVGNDCDDDAVRAIRESALQSFEDDLDTASVILRLREVERDESLSSATRRAAFLACDALLGLGLDSGEPAVREIPQPVLALLSQRAQARRDRDWARSDSLRDLIAEAGITVTDTPDGQVVDGRVVDGPVAG